MIPGFHISPLDRTAERDGVSVKMSRDVQLAFELFALSPGRVIHAQDLAERVMGKDWRRNHVSRTKNLMRRVNKSAQVLGLSVVPVASMAWQMRER